MPGVAEQAREIEERVLAVLPHDFPREIEVDQRLVLDLLDLLNHRRRQCPQPASRPYQHGLRDSQRQRQVEQERRPTPTRGRDIDAAAQRRNIRAHDVGAHAAAGDLGDLGRGRESRRENGFGQLRLGRLGITGNEAQRLRFLADALEIEPGAIVRDLDRDFIALLADGDGNFSRFRFPALDPLLAAFDAVVERVAKQMLEGTDELLEHRAVQLDLRPANLQIRALVELLRRLAHDPVEPLGQAAERNGANREKLLLHVA